MTEYRRSTIILITAFALSGIGALSIGLLGGDALTRGIVQLCIAPLFVLLFSRVGFNGIRMPRLLVGFALIGVLTGAVARYSERTGESGNVLIATFASDPLRSNVRVLRENINRQITREGGALVEFADRSITSQGDARRFLAEHPERGGIIWGSIRWINLTLQPSPPVRLADLPVESIGHTVMRDYGIADLQLITSVPELGISMGLNAATLEFLGRIIPLVRDASRRLSTLNEDPLFEQGLRMASSPRADWLSLGHRAIPMALTGTYHLLRAISGETLQEGELSCAEISFKMARAQIPAKDNPEFMALILNNEAIVDFFRAASRGEGVDARLGLEQGIGRAFAMRSRKNASANAGTYWEPLAENLIAVRSAPWIER